MIVRLAMQGDPANNLAPSIADFAFVAGEHAHPETALRGAVREYLETPQGERYLQSIRGNFNWGDALERVPPQVWERHGLRPLEARRVDDVITVEHDEIIADHGSK